MVVHSKEYSGRKPWGRLNGKKVLVVGGSISGPDIACELAERGFEVVTSVRTGKYFVPLQTLDGQANDFRILDQFGGLVRRLFSERESNDMFKELSLMTFGNPREYGAVEPTGEFHTKRLSPVVKYLQMLKNKKLTAKGGLKGSTEDSVVFEDGSEERFDVIILATGHRPDHSFLSKEIKDLILHDDPNNLWLKCYRNVVHPKLPNFAMLGYGGVFATFITAAELEAMYICSLFKGIHTLPSEEIMLQWIESFSEWAKDERHYYENGVPLLDDMMREIGCNPSVEDHPEMAKAFLLGPLLPISYRISGPFQKPGAKEQLIEYYKQFELTELLDNAIPHPMANILYGFMEEMETIDPNLKTLFTRWQTDSCSKKKVCTEDVKCDKTLAGNC